MSSNFNYIVEIKFDSQYSDLYGPFEEKQEALIWISNQEWLELKHTVNIKVLTLP